MTWPTFKPYNSLKCIELVRRAEYLAMNGGQVPEGPWVTNERSWTGEGLHVFFAPGRLLKILLNGREVYVNKIPQREQWATFNYEEINVALEIVRKNMVLDDLANGDVSGR